jgi:hypothetical protein
MSDTVNVTANHLFNNNLELQLQATKSQLWDTVEVQDADGEATSVKDLLGQAKPQEADERHGDLKQTGVPHSRVWLTKPNELYFNEFVDGADQLATQIALEGAYTMAAMATMNRAWDDRVLQAVYAPILTGKTVGEAVQQAFPNGQIVPVTVGGASGPQRMNVDKLRAANKLLAQGFAMQPGEKKFMVIDAEQNDDLLREVPATSSDFKASFGGEIDENGNIRRLLGWNFVHMELRNAAYLVGAAGLTVDSNGYTRNPFWVKSGIRLGVWQKLRTAIKDQPQKVNTRSVFAGTTVAGTRTQAGRVGIILNSEA